MTPRPWWGQWAHRWASPWPFLMVCAEILCLRKPTVSSAIRVAGFRWSHRWRSRMWRSWDGVVLRPVRHIAKFFKTTLAACGREINFSLSGNSSVGHSCSQHANCTLPQLETSVALRCVTKLHILEWPFIVPSTRCSCVMMIIILLFNQLLDMPHLSDGWIILEKEKCSLTVTNLREISFLFVWTFLGIFLFLLMKHGTNTWHVAFTFCSVYFRIFILSL